MGAAYLSAPYSTLTLLLNLSRARAAKIPTTKQTTFTALWATVIKPSTGTVIIVAAMTIPIIPWKATE